MKKIWMIAWLFLLPKVLFAQDIKATLNSALHAICVVKANSSDEVVACKGGDSLSIVEKSLNDNYRLLLSNLKGQAKLFISREKQSWQQRMNETCKDNSECRLRKTFEQNQEIEEILHSLGFLLATGD